MDAWNMQSIGEELSSSVFEALWGHERAVLPTAVDYAYEQIWKQLVFSNERKERRLSDVVLAQQLGVSRTPVRQALERLVLDGLVRLDPRRGFRVRVFTVQDIREIYDIRGALEVLALQLAVPHLAVRDLEVLLEDLQQVRAQIEQHPVSRFLHNDFRLHTYLIRASQNERLIHYLSTLRGQFSMFQIRDSQNLARIVSALDDHELILQALLEQASEKATALLAAHIQRSKEFVLTDCFTEI